MALADTETKPTHLLEGVLKQRLPGHIDLHVAGQRVGLRTREHGDVTSRQQTDRGRRDHVRTKESVLYPPYLAQVSEVGEFPPEAAFVRDLRATLSPRDTHED